MILPPGTILQHLYFRERIRRRPPGRFVEIGVGRGHLSRLLLRLGWDGIGFDVSADAVHAAAATNAQAIGAGRYDLRHDDWLRSDEEFAAQLVVSSMVLEHLDDADEARYFEHAAATLADGGVAAAFVPSSPRHWGIEDDIAGHLRRYTADGLVQRLDDLGWRTEHTAGLTYPLSNILLPASNRLVARAEGQKRELTLTERTEASGVRTVPLKTLFPAVCGLALNPVTLYPLHLVQKAARRHPDALVLYFEATPAR